MTANPTAARDRAIEAGQTCCDLHKPYGCCDPNDCGPCCAACPSCPSLARRTEEGETNGR